MVENNINIIILFFQFWCWSCRSLIWRSNAIGRLSWSCSSKFRFGYPSRIFSIPVWFRLWGQFTKVDVEGLINCQWGWVSVEYSLTRKKKSEARKSAKYSWKIIFHKKEICKKVQFDKITLCFPPRLKSILEHWCGVI